MLNSDYFFCSRRDSGNVHLTMNEILDSLAINEILQAVPTYLTLKGPD